MFACGFDLHTTEIVCDDKQTFSPVKGQTPPLASVAAITLPASQLVSIEQS